MTDVPVLEINVSKKLGDFSVDVQLSSDGGVMALFGRSGAGKSSIVKMIAGLLTPDAGLIKIFGETIYDSSSSINIKPENRSIGYIFQEDLLFPHMNVTSNLRYGINRNPTNKQEIIFDDVVEVLGLENILERMPHNLSGGERQRVSIGRALISNPKLLLMDEPLTSLDLVRKSEILPYIERLSGEFGIPVVYVSHSLEEVVRLADTIALISDGKSVANGGLAEIMSRLDLAPLTGRHDAGAVLDAVVINPTSADGLSSLDVCGHTLWVPEIDTQSGDHVRMRVRARDVVLAKTLPQGT
ncbi:MAG: molybdenum ABC transporter ATP-binding protein, partial [Rhodospirillaceae bacterium]|nr:molybdenum ABC transporter ATP-binding protein [Rhodospirillaceae bacterium]